MQVHLYFPALIHDPATKVVRHYMNPRCFRLRNKLFGIGTQIFEHIMSFGAIHKDLVHNWKLDFVLLLDSLLDLMVHLVFLISKLITRESNDLKAIRFVYLIEIC